MSRNTHWNIIDAILIKFPALAALKVDKETTTSTPRQENWQMTTFHFGCSEKGLVNYLYTVYPTKYAHGLCFAVLCCGYTLTDFPISIRLISLALWQSNPSASKATLMNMDKYFMWIHYERLHNHNKAKHNKTVCIFLGIYCMCVYRDTPFQFNGRGLATYHAKSSLVSAWWVHMARQIFGLAHVVKQISSMTKVFIT